MSTGLNPYLHFDGNCAEAMAFYGGVFGVEPHILRFSDSPEPVPEGMGDRVMHATVATGGFALMASDTMKQGPFLPGNNVLLSLSFDDADEQTRVFEALQAGGQVIRPLEDHFWGRFGMCIDKFGVHWMFNKETPHGS